MKVLQNNRYSHVCGFNYCPSYMMVLNDVMDLFDPDIVAKELDGAKMLRANAIRVWISNVSWQRDPEVFLKKMDMLLSIAEERGLKVMPTLFNRWIDAEYPIGQLDMAAVLAPMNRSNREYVQSVVAHFAADDRIFMWDICNEPFFYPFQIEKNCLAVIKEKELAYWLECTELIRKINPDQPITAGFAGPVDEDLQPLYKALDVISFHPYTAYWNNGYAEFTDTFIDKANELNKPLICTETCQGSLDDKVRADAIESSLSVLKERNIGWLAWHLCESKIVTGNRQRTDGNCRPGERGYMPFLMADGSIRPEHEMIFKYTKQ